MGRNIEDHERADDGLKAAFGEPPGSVLEQIEGLSGARQPRILLRDAPEDASPILRLAGPGEEDVATDDSRYQILGEIARGGIGVIHKGRDRDLGRDVALKVLRADLASDGAVVQRFVEEAQVGGQLQHPGIVPIYGLGLQPGGRPYFAMKLIKGETLTALLEQGRGGSELVAIFERVAQTIAYAHSRGVIHRDLKPSNVMVGAFGEVQVVDWGFAKVLGREEKNPRPGVTMVATVRTGEDGSQSIAGSVMGTPAYMPPEQALGQVEELTERSDVFSLGAILTEILTRKPPYTGTTQDQLLAAAHARLEEAHKRLDECSAPDALKELARDCLNPLPKDRPKDAGVVAQRIADHLQSVEERARQADLDAVHAAAESRRVQRGRRVAIALSALVLVAIVGGSGGVHAWIKGERERASATAAKVTPLLREATRLEGEKDWPAAKAAAATALALAEKGGGNEETLASARALDKRIRTAAAAADAVAKKLAREAKLIDDLDELVVQAYVLFKSQRERGYKAAFAEFGVDPERADAFAALGDFGRPVELAVHLDGWVSLRRGLGNDTWRPLDRLARALDRDPWRTKLRDTVPTKDAEALRALAASPDVGEQQPATLVRLASALVAAGDQEAAVTLLREARVRHAADYWICYRLAAILWWDLRRASEAMPYAKAALALRPESGGAWNTLGAIRCDGLEDYDGAIRAFRRAILLKPNSATYRTCLGNALCHKGDVADAIAEFREAIRLDPRRVDTRHNLGVALKRYGDLDGAIAAYREAIRLDPEKAGAHISLGSALWDTGDRDGAIAEYREAIQLDPGYVLAHNNLGSALKDKGDVDGAMAEYREAIRLDPGSSVAHNGLGNALKAKGDVDGAIAEYREAIRLDPEDAPAHSNVGIALREKGDIDGALAEQREAARLDPSSVAIRCNLGALLCDDLGRYDEAIAEFREALRLDPGNATALASIGVAFRKKGDLGGWIAAYREILRLDPACAPAHNYLGNALREKGDLDGAIAEHREALRLDPACASAHDGLGCDLGKNGDIAGAIGEFREAIRLDPGLATARFNLGVTFMYSGDLEGAVESFRKAAGHPQHGEALAFAERLLAAAARLPAVLRGDEEPATGEAWADLATVSYSRKDYATSLRLWKRAFEKEPGLANELDAGHRYDAARTAARAGEGSYGDALAWLRADLEMRRAMVANDPKTVAQALRRWKVDRDLASVRDGGGPTAEWQKLWADVDALLAQAEEALK